MLRRCTFRPWQDYLLPILQCEAVIEAGNGAITPEGDAVLQRRGIPVLPVSPSVTFSYTCEPHCTFLGMCFRKIEGPRNMGKY